MTNSSSFSAKYFETTSLKTLPEMEAESALVLSDEEWRALAGICRYYLHEQEYNATYPDRITVAHRIVEADK